MELREFLRILWKRRLAVIAVVLITTAAGVAFGALRQPVYESTTTVAVTPRIAQLGVIPADNLSALLGTYAQTAESDVIKRAAERQVGHPLTGSVSASSQAGTGILQISASSSSPAQAQETSDAVTHAFLRTVANGRLVKAEIVNPAQTPTTPVQPRMPLIIGASILVGLGLAVLLALALERFRGRIESAEDVADIVQTPILGQIPRRREMLRSTPQIVWDQPGWVDIRESFRSLRTNLQFVATVPLGAQRDEGMGASGDLGQVIQVTSPTSSEGKSTLVANLGVAFAQLSIRTVIVDADLRRPAQHRIFRVDNNPTVWSSKLRPLEVWSSELESNPSLEPAPGTSEAERPAPTGLMARWAQPTPYPQLDVVTAEDQLGDPTELLHIRFARLVEELKAVYDLVLVDTPPVLPVTDAVITAARVDAVVVVVVAGAERPSALRQTVDGLQLSGTPLAGVVLNQTTETPQGGYYYQQSGIPVAPGDQLPGQMDSPDGGAGQADRADGRSQAGGPDASEESSGSVTVPERVAQRPARPEDGSQDAR